MSTFSRPIHGRKALKASSPAIRIGVQEGVPSSAYGLKDHSVAMQVLCPHILGGQ